MSAYKVNGPLLWDVLNARREFQGISWRQLARQLGVSASTFTRLQDPQLGVNADVLVTVLAWLDADWKSYALRTKPRVVSRTYEPGREEGD